jgi:hypothetical protein
MPFSTILFLDLTVYTYIPNLQNLYSKDTLILNIYLIIEIPDSILLFIVFNRLKI